MTKDEIIKALRAAGYAGPVSYPKDRLEKLLEDVQGRAAAQRGEPPKPNGDGRTIDKAWCGLSGRCVEWIDGEKHKTLGTTVRVKGEPGKKFEFIQHVTAPNGLQHVEVVGPIPGYGTIRCFDPSRILDVKKRKPVMQ